MGIYVVGQAKLEVELPGMYARRSLSVLVHEAEADLYDFEKVYIALESLVVVVSSALEGAHRPGNHAGELGVYGNVGVVLHQVHHAVELLLEVEGPDVPDAGGPRAAGPGRRCGCSGPEGRASPPAAGFPVLHHGFHSNTCMRPSPYQLLYGREAVYAALAAGKRKKFGSLLVLQDKDLRTGSTVTKREKDTVLESILGKARELGVQVKATDKHQLNLLADNRPHNGVVLEAQELVLKEHDLFKADSGLNAARRAANAKKEAARCPIWVALDQIGDPQNLGAILRSCFFFGVHEVVLCKKNSASLTPVVAKASSGALDFVNLRHCTRTPRFIKQAKVVGLSSRAVPNCVDLRDLRIEGPTVFVLGSEGHGLRAILESQCHSLVRIPSLHAGPGGHNIDSLNVTSALSIVLHHFSQFPLAP